MSLTNVQEPDDPTLVRYLVGRSSPEDAERLDERSIADEAFALRLRAVECDLVDGYLGGELSGETLEGFKAQYLSTPAGLAEVEFARALRGYPRHAAVERVTTPAPRAGAWRLPPWGLAAAAALLLATTAYLLIDAQRLRRDLAGVRAAHAALEQRSRQLEADMRQQQAAASATAQELARAREALAAAPDRPDGAQPARGGLLLALALAPALRGGGEVPAVVIPAGTEALILRLRLTAGDFARYEAVLKEAATDRVVWRSERLRAPAAADRATLPVTVRADLLRPGAYTLELTGISAQQQTEPLDTYPFRVVP